MSGKADVASARTSSSAANLASAAKASALNLFGVAKIVSQLGQPAPRFLKGRPGAGCFSDQMLPRDSAAFQRGARSRFGFSQRRESIGGFRRRGARRGDHFRGLGDGGFSLTERRLGRRTIPLGARAQDRQQFRFGGANRSRYITIAARLARLAFQRTELGFQLRTQILGPREVRIRRRAASVPLHAGARGDP